MESSILVGWGSYKWLSIPNITNIDKRSFVSPRQCSSHGPGTRTSWTPTNPYIYTAQYLHGLFTTLKIITGPRNLYRLPCPLIGLGFSTQVITFKGRYVWLWLWTSSPPSLFYGFWPHWTINCSKTWEKKNSRLGTSIAVMVMMLYLLLRKYFCQLNESFFTDVDQTLPHQWEKCVDNKRDFFFFKWTWFGHYPCEYLG